MEGIEYHPNGEISIGFDDQTWRLGRPKLKTYKRFRERLADMRKAIFEANNQINLLREQLTEDDTDLEAVEEQIETLNAPVWEYSIPILADMVETVAGKPLPEDPDEWPAWLATSISIPTDIIQHWHEVPKAPGSAGTN